MNTVEAIKSLAESKGMSIAEVERKANIGNGTIRNWNKSLPSADKLYRVAKVLGVSIEYLISGEEALESEKTKIIARKAINLNADQLDAIINMIEVFESK